MCVLQVEKRLSMNIFNFDKIQITFSNRLMFFYFLFSLFFWELYGFCFGDCVAWIKILMVRHCILCFRFIFPFESIFQAADVLLHLQENLCNVWTINFKNKKKKNVFHTNDKIRIMNILLMETTTIKNIPKYRF